MREPRTKWMAAAAVLSAILMAVSVYFAHQANILSTEAANLANGTALDAGISMSVIWRLILTIVMLGVSISLIAKGNNCETKTISDSTVSKNRKIPALMLSASLSIGTGLGISLGVAFDNIAVGLSIGSGMGISIGMVLYQYFSSRTCAKK
jgi:hypothetical protein